MSEGHTSYRGVDVDQLPRKTTYGKRTQAAGAHTTHPASASMFYRPRAASATLRSSHSSHLESSPNSHDAWNMERLTLGSTAGTTVLPAALPSRRTNVATHPFPTSTHPTPMVSPTNSKREACLNPGFHTITTMCATSRPALSLTLPHALFTDSNDIPQPVHVNVNHMMSYDLARAQAPGETDAAYGYMLSSSAARNGVLMGFPGCGRNPSLSPIQPLAAVNRSPKRTSYHVPQVTPCTSQEVKCPLGFFTRDTTNNPASRAAAATPPSFAHPDPAASVYHFDDAATLLAPAAAAYGADSDDFLPRHGHNLFGPVGIESVYPAAFRNLPPIHAACVSSPLAAPCEMTSLPSAAPPSEHELSNLLLEMGWENEADAVFEEAGQQCHMPDHEDPDVWDFYDAIPKQDDADSSFTANLGSMFGYGNDEAF